MLRLGWWCSLRCDCLMWLICVGCWQFCVFTLGCYAGFRCFEFRGWVLKFVVVGDRFSVVRCIGLVCLGVLQFLVRCLGVIVAGFGRLR